MRDCSLPEHWIHGHGPGPCVPKPVPGDGHPFQVGGDGVCLRCGYETHESADVEIASLRARVQGLEAALLDRADAILPLEARIQRLEGALRGVIETAEGGWENTRHESVFVETDALREARAALEDK